jgi:hypothetical protein
MAQRLPPMQQHLPPFLPHGAHRAAPVSPAVPLQRPPPLPAAYATPPLLVAPAILLPPWGGD